MSGLSISLLGAFEASLNERPLTSFRTRSVQALLIYLTCQPEAHRRDSLMALLWPDVLQTSAQTNLRQTLYQLRQLIPELPARDGGGSVPLLLADRQTAQINPEAAYDLDVLTFTALLRGPRERWSAAVALYRGDFLSDFYLPGSAPFEEWVSARRADLRRQALEALEALATTSMQDGDLETAEKHARQQLAIDNLRESAHRQLIEALARRGKRSEALAQYERCRQLLEMELGLETSAATRALVEAIRAETLGHLAPSARTPSTEPAVHFPALLDEAREVESVGQQVFVARERQLETMRHHLGEALAGHGRLLFVTGDAGRGKSALMAEFGRQAMASHPDLLVAKGSCNAYAGRGDPYLPFREVVGMLTGEVEAPLAAGSITRTHARRLWSILPAAVSALLQHGPSLVDILVPGRALLSRAESAVPAGTPWLDQLRAAVERKRSLDEGLEQGHLFHQFTNVLRALAGEHPLLVMLDDLQWADSASISLLFHLGRRLAGSRILVACAYRPEEVALGREGERHPLEKALTEFKRQFGDVWINLGQVEAGEGRRFVEAILKTQPNRYGEAFRAAIAAHTGGHALFTVELLRAMQERGDLAQDESGNWVETPALDWERLPARVEAVIEARIDRLDRVLREILSTASVEGEAFTAQVVARVQDTDERKLLHLLRQDLQQRHWLVREGREYQIGRHQLSRYHFAHALFQHHLYQGLSKGERRLLHREIAFALETLCQGAEEEVAVQLAYHYQRGGRPKEAIHFLKKAAEQATAKHAHQEAIAFYREALAQIAPLEKEDREQWTPLLIQLQGSLGAVLTVSGAYDEGRQALQTALAYLPAERSIDRARLVRQIGDAWVTQRKLEEALVAYQKAGIILEPKPDAPDAAWWETWLNVQLARAWAIYLTNRGDELDRLLEKIRPHVGQHGTTSQKIKLYNTLALMHMTLARWYMVPDEALTYAERILAFGESAGLFYGSARFTGLFTLGLIHLFREELALAEARLHEALQTATEMGATSSQLMALTYLTVVHRMRGETDLVLEYARRSRDLAQMEQNPIYLNVALSNFAWLAWRAGDNAEVRANGEQALAAFRKASYALLYLPAFPLLALALAEQDVDTAVSLARDIINPRLKRLPDDLTEQLTQAAHLWDIGDRDEAAAHLERGLSIAQQTGYF